MKIRNNRAIADEDDPLPNGPVRGAMPPQPKHEGAPAYAGQAELVGAMNGMDAPDEASLRASRFAAELHPLDGPGLPLNRCKQRQLYHRLLADWYGFKAEGR